MNVLEKAHAIMCIKEGLYQLIEPTEVLLEYLKLKNIKFTGRNIFLDDPAILEKLKASITEEEVRFAIEVSNYMLCKLLDRKLIRYVLLTLENVDEIDAILGQSFQ